MTHSADLAAIANAFQVSGTFLSAEAVIAGHINDSFHVRMRDGSMERNYFLQRINHNIFTNPAGLMDNVQRITAHLSAKSKGRRALTLVLARNGKSFHHHADDTYWRMFDFITGAHADNMVQRPEQAYQAAYAFGEFQKSLVDLPEPRLHETIPNFHNTPLRFATFERVLAADANGRADIAHPEIAFALERKPIASILLDANLPERVTHNDTKFSNVLLDDETGEALCVVDLDTVMPGLVAYDFGDMVRTACTRASEDETNLALVTIDIALFEALARGYLAATQKFLTDAERQSLTTAGKLITFEQGLRFLTDHLAGDTYYKLDHPGHNLERARAQFALVRSIEQNETRMAQIVETISKQLSFT